jgi:hypothetical protein
MVGVDFACPGRTALIVTERGQLDQDIKRRRRSHARFNPFQTRSIGPGFGMS